MTRLSPQRRNKILNLTPDWMEGKITIYQVAKASKTDWHAVRKHLHINAEALRNQEIKIVKELTGKDEPEKERTIWEKIKNRIWSSILTEQPMTQTQR